MPRVFPVPFRRGNGLARVASRDAGLATLGPRDTGAPGSASAGGGGGRDGTSWAAPVAAGSPPPAAAGVAVTGAVAAAGHLLGGRARERLVSAPPAGPGIRASPAEPGGAPGAPRPAVS